MDDKKADLKDGYTRITNKVLCKLYEIPLSGREFRVIFFIISQTWRYHHKEREMSNAFIGKGTGIKANHVSEIISKLADYKIIKKQTPGGKNSQILQINTRLDEWLTTPENRSSTTPKNGSSDYSQIRDFTTPEFGRQNNIDINNIECVGENGKSRFPDTKIFDRLWTEWSYSQAGRERVSRKVKEEIESIGYARMNDARLRYEQDLNARTTKNNQPLSARTWFSGGYRQYLPPMGENGLWRSVTGKAYFGEERLD